MTVTKQQTYVNFLGCSIPTLILVVRVAERLQISNHGSFYDFANHKVGKVPVTVRHILTIFLRDYDVQVCD